MRISLWQQFSSNHSGGYHVIGTFKTTEDAQVAYEEIRKILQEIDTWHRENPMGIEKDWNNGGPLPPEIVIAERLGIKWPETVDWSGWADYRYVGSPSFEKFKRDPARKAQQLIDQAVMLLANTVITSSPLGSDTYMAGVSFKNLLEVFGAEISGHGFDPGGTLRVGRENEDEFKNLHFIAPNEETAYQIEKTIRGYLESDRNSDINLPPWYDHEANFGKILGNSRYLNPKDVELWQKNANSCIETRIHFEKLNRVPLENHALIGNQVKLWRDGLNFTFEKIAFGDGNFGLAALIAYLEVSGFADIRISYSYEPCEPEDY